MAVETIDEARQFDRKRVLKGGKIAYAARCASLPCVVRDLSSTGARLQVKDHASVPETFELLIELDGFEADVEVVWRKAGEVGVIFVDEPVVKNPKRKQVVSSSVPKSRGTLRKARPSLSRASRCETESVTADRQLPHSPDHQPADEPGEIVSTEQQVEALTASLGTLEIASGETLQPRMVADDLTIDDPTIADANDHHCEALQPAQFDLHERNDEITMDQTFSHQSQDEAEAYTADASEVHVQQCSHDAAALHEVTSRPEAPMFREPVEAAHVDAPVHGDEADAPALTEAMQARISTALQAPTRAAENLVRHVAPIIPAPEYNVLTPDALNDVEMESFAEDVAMAEATFLPVEQPEEPCAALIEDHDIVATAPASDMPECALPCAAPNTALELEVATSAPVSESDVSEPTVDALPADEFSADVELRPDLVAFVQMFSKAAPHDDQHMPDERAPHSDFQDATPTEHLAHIDADFDAAVESNVVEFPPTVATPVEPVHASADIEIVEESIVCTPDTTAQEMPNACELQAADGPQMEADSVVSVPVSDTPALFEELLPCADEDEYVAPALVACERADVMVQPENGMDQHFTPTAMTDSVDGALPDEVGAHDKADLPLIAEVSMPAAIESSEPAERPAADLVEAASSRPAKAPSQNIPILIAEDDPDDRLFMREAFAESDYEHDLAFVENGEELLDYLNGVGEFTDQPRPGLILLDLNMPKMDGRTALLHIKANPSLRRIPVIVLTTSNSDDDIEKTYDLGVSSYISKPSSAEGLKDVITTLNGYWSNLVALPHQH